VLNLASVMIGLQYLFLEPNADDPLNKDAADDLRKNRDNLKRLVQQAMSGGFVRGEKFDMVYKH
jgi:ubiquitin-conjugating enzyme E2 M